MINRDKYLNLLIAKKWNGMIKVITGIRRCRKSYLLFNIFKNHLINSGVKDDEIIEVILDSAEFEEFRDRKKLNEYIKSKIANDKKYYVLPDEIQLVDGFELLLNGLIRLSNVDWINGLLSKICMCNINRRNVSHAKPLDFDRFKLLVW